MMTSPALCTLLCFAALTVLLAFVYANYRVVLVLTGKSREEDIVKALDAGANDFIAKPFQPAELTARLKRMIRIPA